MVLGPAKERGPQGRRVGGRAQLPGPRQHARDEKGRSRFLLSYGRREADRRHRQSDQGGAPRFHRRVRTLGLCGRGCRHRSAEARDACRHQEHPKAQGHGAGEGAAPLGPARFFARMEYDLPARRLAQAAAGWRLDKGGGNAMQISVNYLAVVVAAVAGFLVGWGWYTAFGKVWMAALGKSKEDCGKPTPVPFIIAGVSCLVMAWMLAGLMGHLANVTVKGGII